ncbi:GluClalpha [Strongyloides ratti]|uniref:GluClalpha n=1 Tax=Strongyloides ratti TaxID=34506 RepID=A0A090LJS0_STRRB|nr:GluClalpha [Strongyloides ratti]CEF68378.1 GluClalpha [Strongyloides ratti]
MLLSYLYSTLLLWNTTVTPFESKEINSKKINDHFNDKDVLINKQGILNNDINKDKKFKMPKTPSLSSSNMNVIKTLLVKTNYDPLLRPPGDDPTKPRNGPVKVIVNILLRSLSHVNEANMEYTVQLTYRQMYTDSRLAYASIDPNNELPDFFIITNEHILWKPDSFFQNEKNGHRHDIDKPNVFMRVHRNGTILYSVRLSMILSCPMHLQYYPMDVQTCAIDIASYAYTVDDIIYYWKDDSAIQFKDGLTRSLPQFRISNYSTGYCTSKTNTGEYSCLRFSFQMDREFGFYLLHLYLPSTMMVIISFISFWLDPTSVPGRVTLGITTLLTITTKSTGINSKLPPVSYIKAIDVWIGICTTFIFAVLIEFAFVTFLYNRKINRESCPEVYDDSGLLEVEKKNSVIKRTINKDKTKNHPNDISIPMIDSGYDENSQMSPIGNNLMKFQDNGLGSLKWVKNIPPIQYLTMKFGGPKAKRLDRYCRIIFPTLFLIFNICYWFTFGRQPLRCRFSHYKFFLITISLSLIENLNNI